MSWNDIDQTLFAAHLRETLAAIDAALDETGHDRVVIAAGDERPVFQDDQTYPFRPSPWFRWLMPGTPSPGSVIEYAPGELPRLLFVEPEDFWHSPPAVPDEAWTGLFRLEIVQDARQIVSMVKPSSGRQAWIGEARPPGTGWDSNPANLVDRLVQARCRKSAWELANLREATRIAVAGHLAAEQAFRRGAGEYDIHLAFLGAVRQVEAALPYPPIIALNEHGAVLHYQHRAMQPPGRVLSLLIDAGASCRGYGSDITRTWASTPGLFATLVEGMHAVQMQLCSQVAAGADWRALHLSAHKLVAQLLRDIDVLRMSADAALESGVSAAFLPHGLGHLLGLQVHDVGGFQPAAAAEPIPRPPGHPALRLTRSLEPGMVVTVEPGLYFIDSLLRALRSGPHADVVNWPLVERLSPCGGIRIEDNLAVTSSGAENLTRMAFAAAA